MMLLLHVVVVFDVYKPELEEIKVLIKTEMEKAYILDVPLEVDMGVGADWLEAH